MDNDGKKASLDPLEKYIGVYMKARIEKDKGNYIQAVKTVETIIIELKDSVENMEDDNTEYQNQTYMFLKARYMQAKCLNKIREFTRAEFTCD